MAAVRQQSEAAPQVSADPAARSGGDPAARAPAGGPQGTREGPSRPRGRPPRRAWFASDFHLHRDDPATVERACRFLGHVQASGADALFLLGDVFKAWLGPVSMRDPGLAPFLEALREAVAGGLRVVLIHGNHDFLMGPELRALGVEVHAEQLDLDLRGKRVRLLHGDAFCIHDLSYHRLHRVLRSPLMRWVFGRLPGSALEGLARRLVNEATRTTSNKSREMMSIVDTEVVAVLETGVDVVICGHVHEARDARLAGASREGRLVVMADFERSGCHVSFLEGELSLHARDERFEQPGPAGVVVAVDGPAGSGKSSVCRALADELGFLLLDSGALYRTVTARALEEGIPLTGPALGELAAGLDLAVSASGSVLLDGHPVPDELLRGPEVSGRVSQVSADPAVREALMPVQRAAAGVGAGLVAEGRDMASVVFPDADVAVYLDARPEVRAARRMAQNPGEGRTLEEVTAALRERDERDSGRAHAPLTRADGAVLVDTSELSPTQVVQRLVELVRAARR